MFSGPLAALVCCFGAAIMAAPEVAGEEGEKPVSLEGLADLWNANEGSREKLLRTGSLLSWPCAKSRGVITFDSMRLNASVIYKVLEIWLPQNRFPKTVSIDAIRDEDGVAKKKMFYMTFLHPKMAFQG